MKILPKRQSQIAIYGIDIFATIKVYVIFNNVASRGYVVYI